MTPELFTHLNGDYRERACTPPPETNKTSVSANAWHTACVNVLWTRNETYKLFYEIKEFAEKIENESPSPEAHVRVPEGWALVPVKPTMDMVKNAAGDHEGESWLPHSLWASMLAAVPQTPERVVGLDPATIEACARLIEENIIMDTSAGKVLAPRQDGNRDGQHYAVAIRALAGSPAPKTNLAADKLLAEAIETATLKERLRAATVARDATRKALEQGFLNSIPDKVFDAVHEASRDPAPSSREDTQ